jgi:hypothetical protein
MKVVPVNQAEVKEKNEMKVIVLRGTPKETVSGYTN